jgi:tol-pal system protein YbgF
MVRHSIFLCSRFGLAVLLAVAVLPAAAYSQDAATQARLDRIERDLNMLQRQVYRGAPTAAPGAPGVASGNAVDIEIRMERLEEQMRGLTGRVEQVANGLEQLRQRVEQINSDFDVRVSQMSGDVSVGFSPARPGAPGPNKLAGAGAPPPSFPPQPGALVPAPGAAGPSPIFNTLTPPGMGPPRQPPPPAPDPAATEAALPPGSAAQQFNHAFGLVKQADYAGAETALKAFIQQHPNDPLAANAQYWLGETYFVRNQYAEASAAFAEGYKRYPKGPKAEEDLLKLGMSLARADQKKNACVAFAQLDQQFPNSSAAVKERASAERKRLGC